MAAIVKREVGDTSYEEINQQNPFPVEVIEPSPRRSVPGAQFGLAVGSTVVQLTPPPGANWAEIYVRTASIVFTRDGTTPTATKGFQADPGDIIVLVSRDEMDRFQSIRQGASATGDVEYFHVGGG